MRFFAYAIYNKERNKIYIGQAADIEKRLKRHNGESNTKNSSFTKRNDGAWVVIHTEEFCTRVEAMRREKQLKTSRGRSFIKCLLDK